MAVIPVEMGETQISGRQGDRLLAIGLGACVGICLFDATAGVAAMVHVVLPQTPSAPPAPTAKRGIIHLPGKCANTAIPNVIAEIEKAGANVARLKAAIVGGAQIFTPPAAMPPTGGRPGVPATARLEIGPRNVEAVKRGLAAVRVPIVAEMVGGFSGRTVTFHITQGQVFVRPIGAEDRLLVTLAGVQRAGDSFGKEGALRG
jgi:chemotaxis protein CheD